MSKYFAAMAAVAAAIALGGCTQIERGYIAKPPPRIAAQDVAVFPYKGGPSSGFTHVDHILIDYEDFSRDKMLANLRKLAGGRGANAIILDRDFPTVKYSRKFPTARYSRDLDGIFSGSSLKKTGATAIYIGNMPPPRIIRPL